MENIDPIDPVTKSVTLPESLTEPCDPSIVDGPGSIYVPPADDRDYIRESVRFQLTIFEENRINNFLTEI